MKGILLSLIILFLLSTYNAQSQEVKSNMIEPS